jgi:hypothetical protein
METIVTEDTDKEEEENRIKKAITNCGYPMWAFDKAKQQMGRKAEMNNTKEKKKADKQDTTETKGMVVIPYVEGLSEKLQRIFRKHNISVAMKPHNTLKRLLVHPKDKVDNTKTCGVVYEIECKGCEKSYVGETGRAFGTRLKEHQKDAETIANRKFTRKTRKESASVLNKSAITDHIAA